MGKRYIKQFLKTGLLLFADMLASSEILYSHLINGSLVIFNFHDVSDNPSEFVKEYFLGISTSRFEEQLKMIATNYNVISPSDLLEGNFKTPAALITFDDGFKGYFKYAVPILEKYKLSSIVFLNPGVICGEIFWSPLVIYLCENYPSFVRELDDDCPQAATRMDKYIFCRSSLVENYLDRNDREMILEKVKEYYGDFASRDDLEGARGNPLIYFGNHLYNHYNAASLSKEEFEIQFMKARDFLMEYPNYIEFFSYPFGQPGTCYNTATEKWLDEFGVKKIFSAYSKINRNTDARLLHRTTLPTDIMTQWKMKSFLFRLWIMDKIRTVIS